MKTYKVAALLLTLAAAFVYSGCDDSGFKSNVPKGLVSFSEKNLKHIDPNVDGNFELWLRLDSAGSTKYFSLGRFNINASGMMVDTSGNPMTFRYQADTNILYQTTAALLTVEPPGDNNSEPSSQILLSGMISINEDSLYTDLKISGSYALGQAGLALLTSTGAGYIMNTPTEGASTCLRGVWLCDTNGTSYFPNGSQLNAPGWVYQAWLVDKTNPGSLIYYSIGRFRDPFGPDFDGAGPCAGQGSYYSKPGQDWVLPNCPPGKPQVQDINNGHYEIIVTLEPSNEQPGSTAYDNPFFLTLYKQGIIVVNCGYRDNLFIQSVPQGKLKVTY